MGVDLHGQAVPGAASAVEAVYTEPNLSPVGQIVFNEIMCNPVVPGAGYVELYNRSTNLTFDLSACEVQGLGYSFPEGSAIPPTNYLLLVADPSAFGTVYGGTISPFDTYSGELSPTKGRSHWCNRGATAPAG